MIINQSSIVTIQLKKGLDNNMKRNIFTNITYEDKFGRKYYCSLNNHRNGLSKLKRINRREARRKLKKMIDTDIQILYNTYIINKEAINE